MGRKRQIEELSGRLDDRDIEAWGRGLHGDGNRLYLQCTPGRDGALRRSWIFRFTSRTERTAAGLPKEKQIGLGGLDKVNVQDARRKARELSDQLENGNEPRSPREEIRAKRAQEERSAVASLTFDKCAAKYIETHRADWRNAKHAAQWESTLRTYVSPLLGSMPVSEVKQNHVIEVLEPIWRVKRETARRVRGRIEAVLAYAKLRKYRDDGPNPAVLSPKERQTLFGKVERNIRHHAALPYPEMGRFMEALRARESVATSALEFTILTAARTSETLEARWPEIDLEARVWTVPAGRMKGKREHRVPLSAAACDVLKRMASIRESDVIFPGERQATLSNMSMKAVLRRMGRGDLTVHGFRSTFRDWAAECTNFPREVAEAALAHVVGDKVEAAYRRGDLFEKRRKLMDAWAAYCAKPATSGHVIPLTRIPA